MLGLSILKSKVVIIKNNNKIFVYNPCRVDNSTSTPAA